MRTNERFPSYHHMALMLEKKGPQRSNDQYLGLHKKKRLNQSMTGQYTYAEKKAE